MSLPASTRRRWRISDGGDVGYLDLGDAFLIVPGGVATLRRRLIDAVSASDWQQAAAGYGDPDLANE
jgi:hypothetical protein